MLPRELGRLERRTLVSREAIAAITLVAIAVVLVAATVGDDAQFLASAYSFGVLLAFTLAQLAVIRLRRREPDLRPTVPRAARRPYRRRRRAAPCAGRGAPHRCRVRARDGHARGRPLRRPGLAGARAGASSSATRWREQRGVLEDIDPRSALPVGRVVPAHPRADEARRHRRGDGRDRSRAREGERGPDRGDHRRAGATGARARRRAAARRGRACRRPRSPRLEALGEENDVVVHADAVRARSIGHAIVEEAARRGADLIVLGSSPRWRRQSRFFSPTVDHVLQHARARCSSSRSPTGCFEEYPQSGMKVVIVGCGRTGSSVAIDLAADGWDVTCVDDDETALARLGEWRGGFVVGHAMDLEVLERAGVGERRRGGRRDGRRQHEPRGRPGPPAPLRHRVRRGARPRPAPGGVLRGARPADRLPDEDGDRDRHGRRPRVRRGPVGQLELMYAVVAGGGKVGANITRSLVRMGHEVTLVEQRRDRFELLEAELGLSCCWGTRPRSTSSSSPGSHDLRRSSSRSRATTRTTS